MSPNARVRPQLSRSPTVARPPISVATLRERVGAVPRLDLAWLPTPLQEMPRLSERLGVRLLMKRDDLTGLAFGGNKARSLEFRLAEAIGVGADAIVAVLDLQSNSACQTAAAANRHGLETHLVLHGSGREWQGNLLLDALLGADIQLASSSAEAERVAADIVDRLRGEGRRVYSLNQGRMFALGSCLGYALCAAEIVEQLTSRGARAEAIYLSSAGKSQAGVVLGALALGIEARVIGIAARPAPEAASVVVTTVREAAKLLGLDIQLEASEVRNFGDFAGAEYKTPSPEGLEALDLVARLEGVLLDTTYTAKAMAGLFEHIRTGDVRPGDSVVFIHTGGTPVLFAEAESLLAWRRGMVSGATAR
ncbi:MAG TPA: pyridoxal-phosphate dependent enzyme [Candidatus Limnocylindria bacterium]|nr:pyridoxal-phosphate dependent enzyme [Candidatus Limnocylindria bacterium]